MIKLIATDMDGTLLDDDKNLPSDFREMLDKVESMGIRFVIASGRSYSALTYLFGDLCDRLDFICDNGAYVVIDGKPHEPSIIPDKSVKDIIRMCEETEKTSPVLCGENGIYYHKSAKEQFEKEVNNFYVNFSAVDNLYEIKDNIFKIAICDLLNPVCNSYLKMLDKFGNDFSIQVSGPLWMDIMNKKVDKGTALSAIKNKFGIKTSEVMAFGDYYNDISLLKEAEYSYTMANACEDMHKYSKYKALSNNENGVVKAIYDYIGSMSENEKEQYC